MSQLTNPKTIALLTDFGYSDPYVSIMKSILINLCPEARILDIAHGIKPGSISQAAYALEFVLPYLPSSCVVVGVVDPGVGSLRKPILVRSGLKTFIGPDNGLFSRVVKLSSSKCSYYHLTQREYWNEHLSNTFHGRDVFAPVAAHCANGVELSLLGVKLDGIHELPSDDVLIEASDELLSTVIYEDSFGNLITNIPHNWVGESTTMLHVQSKHTRSVEWSGYVPLVTDYQHDDAVIGIVGSTGYLELAAPNSSCSAITGLSNGDKILVRKIHHRQK